MKWEKQVILPRVHCWHDKKSILEEQQAVSHNKTLKEVIASVFYVPWLSRGPGLEAWAVAIIQKSDSACSNSSSKMEGLTCKSIQVVDSFGIKANH